ncbi:DUF3408 domain-containing protein [Flavobacterium zepuense]|uniref:DUF3408 domain-containing protein n=1 Tax=Flavobacterium zepuense TaxID=2593302 RepID=A0A552UZJ5_9FLAO|nr:DUF3408 domain-containing protein [Flavobacterium zepuense]TRW23646.1 DUF3408 domain-containing protein [Flavobacterium zepuense]
MDRDDKINSNNGEIDEQYLMSIMAGGVRKEGLEPKAGASEQNPENEPSVPKEKKQRNNTIRDYEALFLRNTEGNARLGKSVYIRQDFHERLTRIVQVIGEDKVNLYSYLENVLEYHFREFGDQIKKSFDDKYKPIL